MDTSFERHTQNDEWLTPPELIKALGEFDLDPCSPINRPWDTAKRHYTKIDDGLKQTWAGLVYCNPPYGRELGKWLAKCGDHGNTVALTFARTETKAFHEFVWPRAPSLLFIKGRISFYDIQGNKGGTSGAPSVLIAYGATADERLKKVKFLGHYLQNKN